MAIHELYYGGDRMAARDFWSGAGHSYWPAQTLNANTTGLTYIDARFGDGRTFNVERIFDPKELGDNSLLHYLQENAASIASGDILNLFVMPVGYAAKSMSVNLVSKPSAAAFVVECAPLSALNSPIMDITVAANQAAAALYDTVATPAMATEMYVVRVRFTAAVANVAWDEFNFTINFQCDNIAPRDPVINVSNF